MGMSRLLEAVLQIEHSGGELQAAVTARGAAGIPRRGDEILESELCHAENSI